MDKALPIPTAFLLVYRCSIPTKDRCYKNILQQVYDVYMFRYLQLSINFFCR